MVTAVTNKSHIEKIHFGLLVVMALVCDLTILTRPKPMKKAARITPVRFIKLAVVRTAGNCK